MRRYKEPDSYTIEGERVYAVTTDKELAITLLEYVTKRNKKASEDEINRLKEELRNENAQ